MSHQNDEKIDVSNMSQQSEQKSDGSLATIYITKSRICQFLLGKLANGSSNYDPARQPPKLSTCDHPGV